MNCMDFRLIKMDLSGERDDVVVWNKRIPRLPLTTDDWFTNIFISNHIATTIMEFGNLFQNLKKI